MSDDVKELTCTQLSEMLDGMPVAVAEWMKEYPCQNLAGCERVAVLRSILSTHCGHIPTEWCLPCSQMAKDWEEQVRADDRWPPLCGRCKLEVTILRWERIRNA